MALLSFSHWLKSIRLNSLAVFLRYEFRAIRFVCMLPHFLSHFLTYFFYFICSRLFCCCCCASLFDISHRALSLPPSFLFTQLCLISVLLYFSISVFFFFCLSTVSVCVFSPYVSFAASAVAHPLCYGLHLIISNRKYLRVRQCHRSLTRQNKYFWLFAIILKFILSHLKYWSNLELNSIRIEGIRMLCFWICCCCYCFILLSMRSARLFFYWPSFKLISCFWSSIAFNFFFFSIFYYYRYYWYYLHIKCVSAFFLLSSVCLECPLTFGIFGRLFHISCFML